MVVSRHCEIGHLPASPSHRLRIRCISAVPVADQRHAHDPGENPGAIRGKHVRKRMNRPACDRYSGAQPHLREDEPERVSGADPSRTAVAGSNRHWVRV